MYNVYKVYIDLMEFETGNGEPEYELIRSFENLDEAIEFANERAMSDAKKLNDGCDPTWFDMCHEDYEFDKDRVIKNGKQCVITWENFGCEEGIEIVKQ